MQTRAKQSGMTFWGLLMVAALIVFFTVMGFKLLPPYLEDAKVRTALENIAKQPEAGSWGTVEIKNALDRRFQIDDVSRVDLNKNLTVDKKPGVTVIRIAYEVRVPMAYNITALINFDHSVQVNAR